ncbi:C1GALT1.2 family protein [Megaselia abdita]
MLILLFIFVALFNAVTPKYSHHNESLANKLYNEVKILCWVNTWPKNHKTKARAVKETWVKRCNKYLFISTERNNELGTIALPMRQQHMYLWGRTKAAYSYIYKNYFNDYDWFVKADDDTYMIVENLRYMLYQYDPLSPLYLGCNLKSSFKQGYMSGGPGYILSKEALKRLVTIGIPSRKYCTQSEEGAEDKEIGRCLQNLNVTAIDTRDRNGKGRMFPLAPGKHLSKMSHSDSWYSRNSRYPFKVGKNCCSSRTISFHYVTPEAMHIMDFLIYELNPFGFKHDEDHLPVKK